MARKKPDDDEDDDRGGRVQRTSGDFEGDSDTDGATRDEYLYNALDLEREQFEYGRDAYEEDREGLAGLIDEGRGTYEEAGTAASASDDRLLEFLGINYADLSQPVEHGEFVGGYDSQAAEAMADPRSIEHQMDTLAQLKERSEQGLTPIERFEMETTRRTQERDLRSNREAMLSNLQSRGVASSGLEVAAMLGAQQNTGQSRQLADMGSHAMATERADRAARDRGALATDVRGQSFDESYDTGIAADAATEWSKNLENDHNEYVTDTKIKDRNDRWGMVGDLGSAQSKMTRDEYDRTTAPVDFERDIRVPTATSAPGSGGQTDVLKAMSGKDQADKAAAALEDDEDDGIFGLNTQVGPIKL